MRCCHRLIFLNVELGPTAVYNTWMCISLYTKRQKFSVDFSLCGFSFPEVISGSFCLVFLLVVVAPWQVRNDITTNTKQI